MSLHPQAEALLLALKSRADLPVEAVSVAEARQAYSSRAQMVQPPPPEVSAVWDVNADTAHGPLGLRVFRPATASAKDLLPVFLYFHGGGWMLGNVKTHDTLCRELSNLSQLCVVSVDYRLAPEHPYPAALEDARSAMAWILASGRGYGIDATHVAVGGDSAGANLAAVLCIEMRDSGTVKPVFQLLVYPALDIRQNSGSYASRGEGYVLTRSVLKYFYEQYTGPGADPNDWRISPALSASLAGLPSTLVLVAGYDPLHDEGVDYAQRLSAAGCKATLINFERQLHGFITMGKVLDEANDAVVVCAAALRRAFNSGGDEASA
jgi:acetyl esterase